MPRDLPAGTVTFLFSDVEGSTKLLRGLGPDAYAEALMEHRRILRGACAAQGGIEVDNQGDAFFFAFPTAPGALRAARAAQEGLGAGPIRVRIGIHTGTPHLAEEGYIGEDVHKGARIAAAGRGGQVLVSSATAALAGGEGLRDLGEHRLKDLAAAERIYQLGSAEFAPLRTLHQTNLPITATPFVGRERELAELVGLLSGDGSRLVTLTGPGGTGKTRLAMQAAAELTGRYPHGVWWVPLDALRQPDLVLETAARVLGAAGSLAEHVGDRAMLILFDNFEQVIEAAGDLAGLLASCPKLELLVTSRESLRIRGEREYPVPPLAPEEGIRLFVERARDLGRTVTPDGDVSEICRRLDDLPLAIELAAARVKVLSPAQMLERLQRRLPLLSSEARDLPERQRTLRGAIAWSYELLSPEEQRLFARLAVFRGGWTVESAEAVAEADLDRIQSLVEKSLIRHQGERFSMLETIREYAAERLEASGEAEAMRRRHADHFLALAQEHEPIVLRAGDPSRSLDLLEVEHDNLRAALDGLEGGNETEPALLLAGTLFEFWCERGHALEGWRRLEALLRTDDRPTRARAKALIGAAHLSPAAGVDATTVSALIESAVRLNRAVGDAWDIAFAEYELATDTIVGGDQAGALPLLEKSIERFRTLGDEHRELQAMRALGWAYARLGDMVRYRELHETIVRRARESGQKRMEFTALGGLAWVATTEGRLHDALSSLKDAYRLREAISRDQLALLFARLALAHAVGGRAEQAATLLGRSEAMSEETGEADPDWVIEQKQQALARMRADLGEAAIGEAMQRGRAMTGDQAVALGFAPLEDPAVSSSGLSGAPAAGSGPEPQAGWDRSEAPRGTRARPRPGRRGGAR